MGNKYYDSEVFEANQECSNRKFNIVAQNMFKPVYAKLHNRELKIHQIYDADEKQKLWIVVGKQSQGHEKNKVKLVSHY